MNPHPMKIKEINSINISSYTTKILNTWKNLGTIKSF